MDGRLVTEHVEAALADDILRGAGAIAAFLFGGRSHRRKVYHLVATSRLPTFKLGALLCARRTVLRDWIAEQEERGRKGRA
ncbi:MAG: hypothetical protein KIS73_17765 [Enhydrobacter sp.]|nr:hypothetical protein [Enhydrobacter sp.]